uniref:AlNc14C108G6309 protein n=1 Tax=Albugo laibachii Nc14 TaxID=890382 RepID=F0WIA5_9STRA|nr:AlNc14C108G6309 [Albugo laibachii Nc14]|eukprot:CCA20984.1 AlNc14C108G6309 [Albugo laibachii Nc14]
MNYIALHTILSFILSFMICYGVFPGTQARHIRGLSPDSSVNLNVQKLDLDGIKDPIESADEKKEKETDEEPEPSPSPPTPEPSPSPLYGPDPGFPGKPLPPPASKPGLPLPPHPSKSGLPLPPPLPGLPIPPPAHEASPPPAHDAPPPLEVPPVEENTGHEQCA